MDSKCISLVKGDITTLEVDAIVNSANPSFLGGGSVDGAIHCGAGPQLYEECKSLSGCTTGEAKITKGYNLPAKYVIHTVGPVYGFENGKEAELLARCYKNSLNLGEKYQLKTIAFPSIGTGAFHYPQVEAAQIALASVKKYLYETNYIFEKIFFCTFFRSRLQNIFAHIGREGSNGRSSYG